MIHTPPKMTLLLDEAKRAHGAGRLDEARQLYLRVLALDVHHAEALYLLGCEELDAGRAELAVRMGERAVAADARRPEFFLLLARALRTLGRFADSEARCVEALRLDGRNARAHEAYGDALLDQKKSSEAIACYRRAIDCDAALPSVWSSLGRALAADGQHEQARHSFEKAVALDPQAFSCVVNLGSFLLEQNEFEAAAELYRRFIALEPERVEAHGCLSGVLYLQGNYRAAKAALAEALRREPDNAEARWNLALVQLVEGELAEGFKNFEARYRRFGMPEEYRRPHWQGEPLNGRGIVLLDEQGLGDTLQFLRFVPRVLEAGGAVTLRLSKPLHRLAEASWPAARLLNASEPLPTNEVLCPLMSLPYVFGVNAETIPAEVPYLRLPDAARQKVAALAWPREKLRVGLVWAGNPGHALDRYRSIPLAALRPLFAVPDVQFYSLQMGAGATQLAGAALPIVDLSGEINDMADTAALLEQLDLVIAVDTSVLHLAGALGRPAWMLTPAAPDWRWIIGRDDSPWYPTLRLFRQTTLGDWSPVVERVAAALRTLRSN